MSAAWLANGSQSIDFNSRQLLTGIAVFSCLLAGVASGPIAAALLTMLVGLCLAMYGVAHRHATALGTGGLLAIFVVIVALWEAACSGYGYGFVQQDCVIQVTDSVTGNLLKGARVRLILDDARDAIPQRHRIPPPTDQPTDSSGEVTALVWGEISSRGVSLSAVTRLHVLGRVHVEADGFRTLDVPLSSIAEVTAPRRSWMWADRARILAPIRVRLDREP